MENIGQKQTFKAKSACPIQEYINLRINAGYLLHFGRGFMFLSAVEEKLWTPSKLTTIQFEPKKHFDVEQ